VVIARFCDKFNTQDQIGILIKVTGGDDE